MPSEPSLERQLKDAGYPKLRYATKHHMLKALYPDIAHIGLKDLRKSAEHADTIKAMEADFDKEKEALLLAHPVWIKKSPKNAELARRLEERQEQAKNRRPKAEGGEGEPAAKRQKTAEGGKNEAKPPATAPAAPVAPSYYDLLMKEEGEHKRHLEQAVKGFNLHVEQLDGLQKALVEKMEELATQVTTLLDAKNKMHELVEKVAKGLYDRLKARQQLD